MAAPLDLTLDAKLAMDLQVESLSSAYGLPASAAEGLHSTPTSWHAWQALVDAEVNLHAAQGRASAAAAVLSQRAVEAAIFERSVVASRRASRRPSLPWHSSRPRLTLVFPARSGGGPGHGGVGGDDNGGDAGVGSIALDPPGALLLTGDIELDDPAGVHFFHGSDGFGGPNPFEQLADLAERVGGGARGALDRAIAALPTRTVGVAPVPAAAPPAAGGGGGTTKATAAAAAADGSTAATSTAASPPSALPMPAPAAATAGAAATTPDGAAATPDPDGTCAVCLSDFAVGEELRELRCDHAFHTSCIDKWLHVRAVCPVCKADLDGRPASAT